MEKKSGSCRLQSLFTCSTLFSRPFKSWRLPCILTQMIKSSSLLGEMEMWGQKLIQHPTISCIHDKCESEHFIYLPYTLLISSDFHWLCVSDVLRNVLSYSAYPAVLWAAVCVSILMYAEIWMQVSVCGCACVYLCVNLMSWGTCRHCFPISGLYVSKSRTGKKKARGGKRDIKIV